MLPPYRKLKAWTLSVSGTVLEVVALLLTLTGFLLVLLSVISNQSIHLRSLYFMKMTHLESDFYMTFGMHNYCIIKGNNAALCIENNSMMIVPYDVNIVNMFNVTYPELFLDAVPQDGDTDPGARPDPPHDPKIFTASVLCLLCAGASSVLCVLKFTYRRGFYDDIHLNRGFLVTGSTICALLLIALCSVMYSNAVTQMNSTYPHISVYLGPCVPMIGVSFMLFFASSSILLSGRCRDRRADTTKSSYHFV